MTTRLCAICRQEIDPERVEVLPETRLCTEHARAIQKYGGEFKVTYHQESTSKVGSLKKNYGGITPNSHRNDDALRKLREDYHRQQEDRGKAG